MTTEPERVAVVRGGQSEEREISLKSGKAVVEALQPAPCQVFEYDTDHDLGEQLEDDQIDVVFIALHGCGGEDGRIQGLLDWYGIPYTGPGHEASALCMDKLRTKQVLEAEGIPTPRWKVVRSGDVDPGINFDRAVVKPRREGSSIGMSIVPSDEVSSAIQKARNFGSDVIVEEYMDGYEATVGVVGLESVEILPPVGIRPSHDFFDYETKYTKGLTEYDVPADLPDNVKQELREITARTVNAFEAQSLCRVDFILDEEHNPYVLELNTIPGLTETSLLPKAARLDGMSFEQLVWNLVCHAEEEQLWEVA